MKKIQEEEELEEFEEDEEEAEEEEKKPETMLRDRFLSKKKKEEEELEEEDEEEFEEEPEEGEEEEVVAEKTKTQTLKPVQQPRQVQPRVQEEPKPQGITMEELIAVIQNQEQRISTVEAVLFRLKTII